MIVRADEVRIGDRINGYEVVTIQRLVRGCIRFWLAWGDREHPAYYRPDTELEVDRNV